MFNIRRVHDDILPVNKKALAACGKILLVQIPTATGQEIERMREALRNPVASRLKAILLVAEQKHNVHAFAMLLHEPDLQFSYLDFICAAPGRTSGGIGSILYQRCREEALALGSKVLFFDVHPDHPAWCPNLSILKQNQARLKFYERWGARPVIGTAWDGGHAEQAPLQGHVELGKFYNPERPLTYLCCDTLGFPTTPKRAVARKMLTTLLERRYPKEVSAEACYSTGASLRDPQLMLRAYRYSTEHEPEPVLNRPNPIPVVISDQHAKHWVHDRGYYESPVRIDSITKVLMPSGLVTPIPSKKWPDKHLKDAHHSDYLNFLTQLSAKLGDKNVYAEVFPPRNRRLPPSDPTVSLGWYCSDTFTPLSSDAIFAARHAVDCVLTAAEQLLEGYHAAYALVRPPGHHAESRMFGGYCYYNSNAIAAAYLSKKLGKIAILDIDYHHGNGQQEIFYHRSDILTVSIHGDPVNNYPYYAGFSSEVGVGAGKGFNLNLPLPNDLNGEAWMKLGLAPALERIKAFEPSVLVLASGLDTAKADPTGTFTLVAEDFQKVGNAIGALGLPTLIVQEGGYRTRTLGKNATALLRGFALGSQLI